MKTEKSPSAHLWNHKIGLNCRAMLPFASDDRYDHKEACKHTQWVLVSSKKFFRATQSQASAFIPTLEEKVATFLWLPSKNGFLQTWCLTLSGAKKFSRAYQHSLCVFASFLMIISIVWSKREHRTTLQSDFMIPNVSWWRFFSFHTPSRGAGGSEWNSTILENSKNFNSLNKKMRISWRKSCWKTF